VIHDLVILGGGFAGLCLLAHLDQAGARGAIAVVEPSGALPAGIAYATPRAEHLLNVRAERMGLLHDAPDDYARWLAGPAGAAAAAAWETRPSPRAFTPRGLYRAYLAERAAALTIPHQMMATSARAIAREASAWRIETDDGPVQARAVALCVGLALRREADAPAFYAPDPSTLDYEAAAAAAGPESLCVVLGAGLSALDALASLERAGWPGRVAFVSRDGRFPAPHDETGQRLSPAPAVATGPPPAPDARLLALLRAARDQGAPWQAAVDALRGEMPALWRALPDDAKARLAARWGDRWNRMRHRTPHESLARAQRWIAQGRAETIASCIEAVTAAGVRIRPGAGPARTLEAASVIEARGLASQWRDNPLLARMVGDGVAAPGPLGWGLAADEAGVVAQAPFGAITGLGPVLLGAACESTGAPEIRAQAAALARRLAGRA
jgi:uncharacterized NAD(P)/FAD-binding protein YdhS